MHAKGTLPAPGQTCVSLPTTDGTTAMPRVVEDFQRRWPGPLRLAESHLINSVAWLVGSGMLACRGPEGSGWEIKVADGWVGMLASFQDATLSRHPHIV